MGLSPLLRRMFAEHGPVLVDTAERIAAWLDENPGTPIPRVIGVHRFSVGGVAEDRAVFPYTVWMFQRVLDHYAALPAGDRPRVDAFLDAHGGLAPLRVRLRRRVRREHNLLVPE